MKTWVRKTLSVGVLAAGALLFTPTVAQADTAQISVGNDGVLNGNQAFVPIQAPINVCGNGIGALVGIGVGVSGACVNGAAHDVDHEESARAESKRTEDTTQFSWDNDGVANGNQAYVPVQIPVNVCGNGVGALIGLGVGISGACVNGAANDVDVKDNDKDKESARTESSSRTEDTLQFSGDNDGVLNGNQIYVPIQIPINICGNGIGILGIGAGISGACINGAINDADFEESSRTEDTTQFSGDNDGVLNGNQIYVPIQIPINICGNGIGILGIGAGISGACINGAINDADFEESSRKSSSRSEDFAQISGDNDGVLNGNQIAVPIQIPVNVCGNGVGALLGIGVGISGGCVNGAAIDVDHKNGNNNNDDDDDDNDDNGYKKHKKNKKDQVADEESLPLVGGLTGGDLTSSLTGGGLTSLPGAGDLAGVKTSKVNVGGVDPMALVSAVPTA